MDSNRNNNQNTSDFSLYDMDESMQKPLFRIRSRYTGLRLWKEIFLSEETIIYPKDTVIVGQGETSPNLFYIHNGLVIFTYIDESGTEKVLEVLGEDCILNMQPLFGKNPAIATFETLTESKISRISEAEIWKHVMKDRRLAEELFEEMAIIIGGLNRQGMISSKKANERFLQVLYYFAENRVRKYPNSKEIKIKLSQDELARITGITRVSVSKILVELRNKDIVHTDYGEIIIKDIDDLRRRACGIE